MLPQNHMSLSQQGLSQQGKGDEEESEKELKNNGRVPEREAKVCVLKYLGDTLCYRNNQRLLWASSVKRGNC